MHGVLVDNCGASLAEVLDSAISLSYGASRIETWPLAVLGACALEAIFRYAGALQSHRSPYTLVLAHLQALSCGVLEDTQETTRGRELYLQPS